MGGRYVPSLLAAIGDVIEEHMIRIGFLVPEQAAVPGGKEGVNDVTGFKGVTGTGIKAAMTQSGAQPGAEAHEGHDAQDRPEHTVRTSTMEYSRSGATAGTSSSSGLYAKICPRCANRSLNRVEGCWTCTTCQYSHCG